MAAYAQCMHLSSSDKKRFKCVIIQMQGLVAAGAVMAFCTCRRRKSQANQPRSVIMGEHNSKGVGRPTQHLPSYPPESFPTPRKTDPNDSHGACGEPPVWADNHRSGKPGNTGQPGKAGAKQVDGTPMRGHFTYGPPTVQQREYHLSINFLEGCIADQIRSSAAVLSPMTNPAPGPLVRTHTSASTGLPAVTPPSSFQVPSAQLAMTLRKVQLRMVTGTVDDLADIGAALRWMLNVTCLVDQVYPTQCQAVIKEVGALVHKMQQPVDIFGETLPHHPVTRCVVQMCLVAPLGGMSVQTLVFTQAFPPILRPRPACLSSRTTCAVP